MIHKTCRIFPFDVIVMQSSRNIRNMSYSGRKRTLCTLITENYVKVLLYTFVKILWNEQFREESKCPWLPLSFLSLQLIWKQTAWPWSPDPVKWNSRAARANSESCCCHPAGDAFPIGSDSAGAHRMELFQGVCACWTWYRGKWLGQRRGEGSSIVPSVLGAGADQRRWYGGVEGAFQQPQRKQHTYSDRPRWEQFGRSRGQAAGRHAERERVSATGGPGREWHQRRGRKWHHGGAAVQDASPAEASKPSGEQHQHGANGQDTGGGEMQMNAAGVGESLPNHENLCDINTALTWELICLHSEVREEKLESFDLFDLQTHTHAHTHTHTHTHTQRSLPSYEWVALLTKCCIWV